MVCAIVQVLRKALITLILCMVCRFGTDCACRVACWETGIEREILK